MQIKSIVLYEDTNAQNYLEGNVLCYDDGSMEGIVMCENDMYIYGKQDQDNVRLVLLTPFNYPYTWENYTGYLNRKQNNYDMFAFDSEGNYDGMCTMRLLSKKVSKEISDAEIEELKCRIEFYKKMCDETVDFASFPSQDEKVSKVPEKVKK